MLRNAKHFISKSKILIHNKYKCNKLQIADKMKVNMSNN